jgi:hypothetical protein
VPVTYPNAVLECRTAADRIDPHRKDNGDNRCRLPKRSLVRSAHVIAAFLTPKTGGVPANRNAVTVPTTAHVWDALAGRNVYGPLVGRAQDLAGIARAFHWPLEFPDLMASGFDAVLGNPPWERIKLQEQEFFAAREPDIAEAPNAAARGRLIAKLKDAAPGTRDRALYEKFEAFKRTSEASSVFARLATEDGGRFHVHVNEGGGQVVVRKKGEQRESY